MSMSTYVVGFKPPDETWKKMKAVWDACEVAGIKIPDEVMEYFNHERPDDIGVKMNMSIKTHECLSEYSGDGESGYEIDVTKLPKDVTVIRFCNSW